MLDPRWGPFLFDTSAESWFAREQSPAATAWRTSYLAQHPLHISAITVFERVRGYATLARRASGSDRELWERVRSEYLEHAGVVWPIDTAVAATAAEICALLPNPATPPKRSHRQAENRQERLARWRADCTIAATALVLDMLLIHNNAADFEAIRGAIERDPVRFPGLGPLKLIRCDSVL